MGDRFPITGGLKLTGDEESVLVRAMVAGDERARERVIRGNLGLVVRIAVRYEGRGLDLDDLIGAGQLGLVHAAQTFDPDQVPRFGLYAGSVIKQAIRDAIRWTAGTIRLSRVIQRRLNQWYRIRDQLWDEQGRQPTQDDVVERQALRPNQQAWLDDAIRARHALVRESWEPEQVAAPVEDPSYRVETEDEIRALWARLARLEDWERQVIILRFGLDGQPPLPLRQAAVRLGVSRQTVANWEAQALRTLAASAN